MPSVLVVAGVIERGGKILIAQRRRGGRHELKWEFPGGKVEPGEEPQAALERELREELAIEATVGEEMAREQVVYPGRTPIELIFYRVAEFQGEPQNLDFEQITWVARRQLESYDFLEGDLPFVKKLVSGATYN
jgi:8-oxo-dGTP diphosphatase